MSTSSEPLTLLESAAELRAAGTPWAEAARQLAVAPDELRRLAAGHRRDYERLSRRARNEVHRQAVSTAITTLISLMRSPDTQVGILAATTFVRYDTALMRHRGKGAAAQRERDAARTLTLGAESARAQDVRESAKVPNQQGVTAAKNVAQPPAPAAPKPTPQTPPAPAKPATAPVAATGPAPVDDLVRRRARLVDRYATGLGAPPPLVPDGRLDREIGRVVGKAALAGGETPPIPPVNPA
jgi:hypothetical protein